MTFFSGTAFFLGGILGFFFARVGRVVVKVRTRSTGGRATVSMQESKGETEADSSNAAQTGSRYEVVTTVTCIVTDDAHDPPAFAPLCSLLHFFCAFLLSQPSPPLLPPTRVSLPRSLHLMRLVTLALSTLSVASFVSAQVFTSTLTCASPLAPLS